MTNGPADDYFFFFIEILLTGVFFFFFFINTFRSISDYNASLGSDDAVTKLPEKQIRHKSINVCRALTKHFLFENVTGTYELKARR